VKENYGESFHGVYRWDYLAGVALGHNATKYIHGNTEKMYQKYRFRGYFSLFSEQ